SPIRLKDVVAFLGREITLHKPLLVNARHRVLGARRGREILEYPLRRPGQPGHGLLLLETPVKQVADVGLRPETVPRRVWRTGTWGKIITNGGSRGRREHPIDLLRMAARMTVSAPLHVQKPLDLAHLPQALTLILGVLPPIPP